MVLIATLSSPADLTKAGGEPSVGRLWRRKNFQPLMNVQGKWESFRNRW
jgi:hypothetical protein